MNIKIGKNAHTCAICEADFVHEQKIQSLVRVVEQEFQREDFCVDCWDEKNTQEAYSTWNMQYYDPKVAEQEPEEIFSPLRKIFYDTVEENSRPNIAMAYLAAQLLRRQKVFRLIKETKDPDTDAAVILFNDRIGNRLIEVNDPNLAHAELDDARIQLMQRLNDIENPPEAEEEELADTQQDNQELNPTTEGNEHGTTQEIAKA